MTDKPKTGFLCTGKNPLELSVSVHCAYKLMDILKSAGFATGSCYTEIFSDTTQKIIKHAASTLSHLCISNDLVITVGCEGFASADIIPDITDAVCRKKVTYFSNVLCGSLKIYAQNNPDGSQNSSSEQKLRLFPDDDDNCALRKNADSNYFEDKHSLCSKLDKALQKFSEKITSEQMPDQQTPTPDKLTYNALSKIMNRSYNNPSHLNREQNQTLHSKHFFKSGNIYFPGVNPKSDSFSSPQNTTPPNESVSFLETYPSRASAGISGNSLILNASNDVYTTLPLIKALLPAIIFAVYNISGKSASAALQCENSLKTSLNFKDFFKNQVVVND